MRQDTYPPNEEKQEHNDLRHLMGAGLHFMRLVGAGAIENGSLVANSRYR